MRKSCFFTHISFREKKSFMLFLQTIEKPICRRQGVFCSMVRTLLNCSFRALLKLYVCKISGQSRSRSRVPFIVGLLNSLVNSLKALKIYVLFIISSRFLCHSIIQDLLIVGCEEGTGSNFICYAYRPKSRTAVTACQAIIEQLGYSLSYL